MVVQLQLADRLLPVAAWLQWLLGGKWCNCVVASASMVGMFGYQWLYGY